MQPVSPIAEAPGSHAGQAGRLLVVLGACLCLGCAGRFGHVPIDPRWREPEAAGPVPAPRTGTPLRVVVYGDTRGNRTSHRAVVAEIRKDRPDLVIFTGDALNCLPLGHLPDLGLPTYLIPFWPQYLRGYPLFTLATLIPFPATFHEVLIGPFSPPRDPDGFNAFLEDTAPLRIDDATPYLFVPGNHDLYHGEDRRAVARLFGSPFDEAGHDPERLWFFVDVAEARFVVLDTGTDLLGDSNPLDPRGPQLRWLDRVLADGESRGLRLVVCCHLPPFSSGSEDPPAPYVRENLVEGVLHRHGIDLVLSGHTHGYERLVRPAPAGRPVTYVVTGGGGAPFHHALSASARDPSSRVFLESRLHYVLLEITPEVLRGRVVPVPRDPEDPAEAPDRFEVRR